MIVDALISNKHAGQSIVSPIHVDGGCGVAETVLLPEDVNALGLSETGERAIGEQSDGSGLNAIEYEYVLLELQTESGNTWGASLDPTVLVAVPRGVDADIFSLAKVYHES